MSQNNWIDHRGHCDGPHAEKRDGKWRYPQGSTAIRKFVKSSGAVTHELVCTIEGCRFHTSPIPNSAAQALLQKLPVLETRSSEPTGDTCSYMGCESTDIEWHHFAPRNTFADADHYPVMPLCRWHHHSWHQAMNGYQWQASAIL